MTGELLALGISHKTAPLSLRERLALPDGRAARVLADLTAHESVHEAVAVSTCNRTELYLVTADSVAAESAALGVLSHQAGIRPTELLGAIYSIRGREVVEHLFSVAAGLDSMIVGEAEIQGQVKRAYELALSEGVTGPVSNRLFRDALAAGKRARSETGVSRANVSVSSVAVQLAAEFLGDLASRRVLVIGAGENAELTARALRDRGVRTVFVANRRYDRALGLAQRFEGQAVTFDDLPAELEAADIVVSSTGAPHQIVGRDELAVVAAARVNRPLVLLDLAVPRDIEPSARDCPGIALYDMDDLQEAVSRNLGEREMEAAEARVLVAEEVERFERWLESLEVVPTIAALRRRGEDVVAQVLRENASRWESLSDADRERLEVMAHALVSRLLHEPTVRLRGSAGEDDSYRYVNALRELFSLDPALAGGVRGRGRRGHSPRAATALPLRRVIRLGTRGSALALAQARLVADSLPGEVELLPITTSGDRDRGDAPPPEDKARFVKEIEDALLAGEVDMAVHSAKDVPGVLPDGLAIVGVPRRADPRDALCGAGSLADLPDGAVVGTGSLRRRSQLLALRPGLDVRDLRGNVDTRLRRLASGDYDAVVLAAAGWPGSGAPRTARPWTPRSSCPRPARGASRSRRAPDDESMAEAAAAVTDRGALTALLAERAVVVGLDAGCSTPMGAIARVDGEHLALSAYVGMPDGSHWIRDELTGPGAEPAALGRAVAARLLSAGAGELLAAAERAAARGGAEPGRWPGEHRTMP